MMLFSNTVRVLFVRLCLWCPLKCIWYIFSYEMHNGHHRRSQLFSFTKDSTSVTYIPGHGTGAFARTRSLCVSWHSWMTMQTGGICSHCSMYKSRRLLLRNKCFVTSLNGDAWVSAPGRHCTSTQAQVRSQVQATSCKIIWRVLICVCPMNLRPEPH
jgi:hypothetical protein